MKINRPYLKTDKEFVKYVNIFDNFTESYNKKKELKNQLRSSHRELYFTLIHLYRIMLFNHNNVLKDEPELCFIESSEPPSLYTNRRELSLRLKRDGSTIYRQLKRLIEAKIILGKKFHGVNNSFELFINPEFLLIYDKNHQNYIPSSKFSKTEKSNPQNASSANCTRFGLYPKLGNNIISNVDNSYSKINNPEIIQNKIKCLSKKLESYPKQQSKTFPKPFQNTQKQVKKNDKKNTLNHTKEAFTRWFYKYLIAMLFSDKTIFSAEREKTMKYIFENYFENCLTSIACENFAKQLKWRVDATKRFIIRNKFDFSNIYPAQYLNLNNKKSGFVNTQKWWSDSVQYHKRKQTNNSKNKIKQSDYNKLNEQIASLQKNYTLENYMKTKNYVEENIPHLKTEFFNRIVV